MKYCIVSQRKTLQTITITNSSDMEYVATLFPNQKLFSNSETSSMKRKKIIGEINYFLVEDNSSSIEGDAKESGRSDQFALRDSQTIVKKNPPIKRRKNLLDDKVENSKKVENSDNKEVSENSNIESETESQ